MLFMHVLMYLMIRLLSLKEQRQQMLVHSLTASFVSLPRAFASISSSMHAFVLLFSSHVDCALHRLQQQADGRCVAEVHLAAAPLQEGYQQPAPLCRPIYIPLVTQVFILLSCSECWLSVQDSFLIPA